MIAGFNIILGINVELSALLTVLSILTIVGGFLVWLLTRVLADKSDKLSLRYDVDTLKERVNDLEDLRTGERLATLEEHNKHKN